MVTCQDAIPFLHLCFKHAILFSNILKGSVPLTVREKIQKDYPYLYETHLHTSEASACAHSTGNEMAEACKEAGYTGIIVTNHNWHGNHCIELSLTLENWIR